MKINYNSSYHPKYEKMPKRKPDHTPEEAVQQVRQSLGQEPIMDNVAEELPTAVEVAKPQLNKLSVLIWFLTLLIIVAISTITVSKVPSLLLPVFDILSNLT